MKKISVASKIGILPILQEFPICDVCIHALFRGEQADSGGWIKISPLWSKNRRILLFLGKTDLKYLSFG